ncbi:MAG: AtpZ/AtpI family protein [Bacteroidales bacterium]|nr:AtpZ/AtpI family protein [Bacteroidales bacterium]
MTKKQEHNQHHQHSSNKTTKKTKSSLNNYAKYSSLSIQMIVIVLAGVFGGLKLDEYLQWKIPLFTVLLSLLGVFAAVYFAIKDFLKK